MKNFFNKLLMIIKNYRSLISIGLLIGLVSFGLWTAILCASCTACISETKDKMYGSHWNWIDFSVIIIGALIGYLINYLLFC